MIKKKIGKIISHKNDKTAMVIINRMKSHPLYDKKYRVSKKIAAHDKDNQFKVGDKVEIKETRPISKTKSWEVVKKV